MMLGLMLSLVFWGKFVTSLVPLSADVISLLPCPCSIPVLAGMLAHSLMSRVPTPFCPTIPPLAPLLRSVADERAAPRH